MNAPGTPPSGQPPDTTESEEDARVRKVEIIISTVLRVGVVTSLLVVVVGLVVSFVKHPAYRTSSAIRVAVVHGANPYPHTLGGIIVGLQHGDGTAIITFGLLLLLLTPIMRVAVSIFTFVYQRDRTFVVITSTVLAVLVTSFLLGRAGG